MKSNLIPDLLHEQSAIINQSHGLDAFIQETGQGISTCSIQRWRGYLGEYDIQSLVYPMLVATCGGRARIRRMIDGKNLSVDYAMPGDITIIPRQQSMRWNVNREVDVIAVIFSNDSTCDHLQHVYDHILNQADSSTFVGSFTNNYVYTALSHLTNILIKPESVSQEYVDAHLKSLELYVNTYLGHNNDGLKPHKNPFTSQVHYTLERLSLGIKSKILIEDIAKELNVSPAYLSRKFKEEVGTTPHHFFLLKRIKAARDLLMNTDLDILSISLETGFSSQSHFTSHFSKELGMSPLKFRQRSNKSKQKLSD